MKREDPIIDPDDSLVVEPLEPFETWKRTRRIRPPFAKRKPKPRPPLLAEEIGLKLDSLFTNTFYRRNTITYIVLGAIEDTILNLFLHLEGAEDFVVNGLFQLFEPLNIYQEGIRITVKVVFGRDLPHECPEDHAAMSGDVCRNCGMTVGGLGNSVASLNQPVEPAKVNDLLGFRIN